MVKWKVQWAGVVPGSTTVTPTGVCFICAGWGTGELQNFVSDRGPVTHHYSTLATQLTRMWLCQITWQDADVDILMSHEELLGLSLSKTETRFKVHMKSFLEVWTWTLDFWVFTFTPFLNSLSSCVLKSTIWVLAVGIAKGKKMFFSLETVFPGLMTLNAQQHLGPMCNIYFRRIFFVIW